MNSKDTMQLNILSGHGSEIDLLLIDTPKILKAGEDYITVGASPYDKLYFGNKFSPYKIEPHDIASLEQIIDSLINTYKAKGRFKNKSLKGFKYQIFSAKTAKQKLQARVLAICNEEADKRKWSSSDISIDDGGDCYFSIIYDFTDRKVILFQINSEG